MKKIGTEFIKNQYVNDIEIYSNSTKEIELWESEKYAFQRYLRKSDKTLDLGCGTGRTTFGLFQEGFENIIGVDLTPEMIEEARELNKHFETDIDFRTGDAAKLKFEDSTFDGVIFSFNGLMSVPSQTNRDKAIREIGRLLKPKGVFIFTTHDRNRGEEYSEFWKEEKARWHEGNQNPKLYEFGDLITTSKNESGKIFIHIPSKQEIADWIKRSGFELIETFYRSDRFEETAKVKTHSGECRFWITKKTKG